jgi:hypothetical protein
LGIATLVAVEVLAEKAAKPFPPNATTGAFGSVFLALPVALET